MSDSTAALIVGIFLILYYGSAIFLSGWIARVKGRSAVLWCLLAVFLAPFAAMLVTFARSPREDAIERFDRKKNRLAILSILPAIPLIAFPMLVALSWLFQ